MQTQIISKFVNTQRKFGYAEHTDSLERFGGEMRLLAFRFPVERVEGDDVEETLPRVAALIDVRLLPPLCQVLQHASPSP